ncbi:hypothetical protein NGA_2043000, partial [Nannochloropsis gaditana CCMP526]|uniref:uncharacterized protein n=1 Tax=Nannochloropsis gaditana (strain CCMP526) TaxID=1093141 RepID=UPI00029F5EA1
LPPLPPAPLFAPAGTVPPGTWGVVHHLQAHEAGHALLGREGEGLGGMQAPDAVVGVADGDIHQVGREEAPAELAEGDPQVRSPPLSGDA